MEGDVKPITQGPPSLPAKKRFSKRIITALILVFILLISIIALVFYLNGRNDKGSSTNQNQSHSGYPSALKNAASSVSFPVYYPLDLPDGYKLNETSIITSGNVVYFNFIDANGDKLVIAQQTRPPITEEVKKITDFNTSLGKAFIADLAGNITGFVYADKTLIIINSPSGKVKTNDLRQIMVGLQQVE